MPYEGQTHRMADFVETLAGLPLAPEIKEGMLAGNLLRLLAQP
jgi:hypothetical protein